MLDPDESLPEAEPADAWRGVMGTGVDWTGRTLATSFSSIRGGGRLSRKGPRIKVISKPSFSARYTF